MKRRTLMNLVARAGGTTAVLTTLKAMGWLPAHAQSSQRPTLQAQSGNNTSVLILGAGLAGMTAAYELEKAGYSCRILEAYDRAGGRCWTVRGGDSITEFDQTETVPFDRDPSLYFNLGPARIPYHHTAVLGYCKEFGVPLEVIVNENRAAYFQDDGAFGGGTIQNRQVVNDSRGYVAELLAKAINRNALDQEVSADEREKLLDFVSRFGNLNDDYAYAGSSRAGYHVVPGAADAAGDLAEPLAFSSLLDSAFWRYKMHFGEGYNQAATMLQPVGGMDQIAKAFVQRVGHLITYNAIVNQIRKTPEGVSVVYTQGTRGEITEATADFAICTFPLSVLNGIEADFSAAHQAAIAASAGSYANAVKVAFQSRRFWEEEHHIYGGISWTESDITQIWYPSGGFHQAQGTLVGAYIWDNPIAARWEPMTKTERLTQAIADGSKIHPDYATSVSAANGCSVAWGKIPYIQGGWMEWEDDTRATAYAVLNQPDDTIYLAGEHLSYLTGWQEGAILSAHEAVRGIASRVQATHA